jgi:hypothetical protein
MRLISLGLGFVLGAMYASSDLESQRKLAAGFQQAMAHLLPLLETGVAALKRGSPANDKELR